MVWCNHCAKNVPEVRPYDGALACYLCGMMLENFILPTCFVVKYAAGQEKQQKEAEEAKNAPSPATAMEAVRPTIVAKRAASFHELLLDSSPNEDKVEEDDAKKAMENHTT